LGFLLYLGVLVAGFFFGRGRRLHTHSLHTHTHICTRRDGCGKFKFKFIFIISFCMRERERARILQRQRELSIYIHMHTLTCTHCSWENASQIWLYATVEALSLAPSLCFMLCKPLSGPPFHFPVNQHALIYNAKWSIAFMLWLTGKREVEMETGNGRLKVCG